jgi:hypothetical protein
MKTRVRIAGLRAQNWSRNLWNTKRECQPLVLSNAVYRVHIWCVLFLNVIKRSMWGTFGYIRVISPRWTWTTRQRVKSVTITAFGTWLSPWYMIKNYIVSIADTASLRTSQTSPVCAVPDYESGVLARAPWWWRQHVPLKRRSIIILNGGTSQKTNLNFILAAVRSWNLTWFSMLVYHPGDEQ